MSPLVQSPAVAGAIVVGVIVLACVIARALEYRDHWRSRGKFTDRPVWDARDRQRHFDNIMGNRK
jgi:hypothetical protein